MTTYFETIVNKYPEFHDQSYQIIDHGQNNTILLLDNKTIFRFPKTEINKKALAVEWACLPLLKDEIHFNIPNFKYGHLGDTPAESFVGYDMIHGIPMTKDVFDKKTPEMIGEQLSAILFSLHQGSLKELFQDKVPVLEPLQMWQDMFQRIEKKLFPLISQGHHISITEDFKAIIKAYEDTAFETCLVHGDFGPTNILVNEGTSIITGIIDFGEIHIGDPAGDIASLIGPFGYGEDLILNHFIHYPKVHDLLSRAKLIRKSFALQEALYGIENDDSRALEAGLKGYR